MKAQIGNMMEGKQNIKQRDVVGEDTLRAIHQANKFNQWMYETIQPFCEGNILEIGAGIGNLSKQFLQDGHKVMLTDYNEDYCDQLHTQFADHENCLGIQKIDLVHSEFNEQYAEHIGAYDTIFALNVIEHIEDDYLAIKNCSTLLKNQGKLILLAPSYQLLYNSFDVGLDHFRRYNKSSLSNLMTANDLKYIHGQYFNFMGIGGWIISGSIFKMKQISTGQMNMYNALVPFNKMVDRLLFRKIGLSTIVIGEK